MAVETTTEQEQSMFPIKIQARKTTIEMLKATTTDYPNDEDGPYQILDRYTSQIVVKNEGERERLLHHITTQHGKDSTNGIPKAQRNKVASIIHELLKAAPGKDDQIPDEAIAEYEKMEYDETGLKANGFDDDPDATLPEENPESRAAAKEDADPKGWKWAAGNFLIEGKISQSDYQRICEGTMNPDAAIKRVHFGIQSPATRTIQKQEEQPKPKKNGKGKSKAKKQDKPAREKPTWTVTTIEEDGTEAILYEAITSKDLLLETGDEKDTGKSRKTLATRYSKPVKMLHNVSGKFYVSKPAKVAATTK